MSLLVLLLVVVVILAVFSWGGREHWYPVGPPSIVGLIVVLALILFAWFLLGRVG
jgi:hypothetical protein